MKNLIYNLLAKIFLRTRPREPSHPIGRVLAGGPVYAGRPSGPGDAVQVRQHHLVLHGHLPRGRLRGRVLRQGAGRTEDQVCSGHEFLDTKEDGRPLVSISAPRIKENEYWVRHHGIRPKIQTLWKSSRLD